MRNEASNRVGGELSLDGTRDRQIGDHSSRLREKFEKVFGRESPAGDSRWKIDETEQGQVELREEDGGGQPRQGLQRCQQRPIQLARDYVLDFWLLHREEESSLDQQCWQSWKCLCMPNMERENG